MAANARWLESINAAICADSVSAARNAFGAGTSLSRCFIITYRLKTSTAFTVRAWLS